MIGAGVLTAYFLIVTVAGFLNDRRTQKRLSMKPSAGSNSYELADRCPRCGSRLRGMPLTNEQIAKRTPPVAWRVCFGCGFEDQTQVREPWTRTQGEAVERDRRREQERVAIADYERQIEMLAMSKRQRSLSRIDGLLEASPQEFEYAVAEILEANRYRDATVCGGSGDLSVDIECINPLGKKTIVQCKRYRDQAVGSKDIQTFIGMARQHHRVSSAMYVTTSRFTKPAQELAKKHRIKLIDGEELSVLARAIAPGGEDDEDQRMEDIKQALKSLETWSIVQKERKEERQRVVRKKELERRRRARHYARHRYRPPGA